jgi:hypothetical protein
MRLVCERITLTKTDVHTVLGNRRACQYSSRLDFEIEQLGKFVEGYSRSRNGKVDHRLSERRRSEVQIANASSGISPNLQEYLEIVEVRWPVRF